MKRLNKLAPENIKIIYTAVLPKETTTFKHGDHSYPFSLSLLFDCIVRVINRKAHGTLFGDPRRITAVLIEIYNTFRGFDISHEALKKKGVDIVFEIPFVNEVDDFEAKMGEAMLAEFLDLLDEHKPGESLTWERVEKMVDFVKQIRELFKFPSKFELYQGGKKSFSTVFKSAPVTKKPVLVAV